MPRLASLLAAAAMLCGTAAPGASAAGPGCRDMDGKPVDFWIAIKYPKGAGSTPAAQAGLGFAYMDSNVDMHDTGVSLNTDSHAIAYTLDQIYKANRDPSDDLHFLMIDDQAAPKDDGSKGKSSGTRAHQKGEIALSPKAGQGFWLIHSVPRFPPNPDQKYAYEDFAATYAQSFICVTLDAEPLREVLKQMQVTWPLVYGSRNPSGDALFQAVIDGVHAKDSEANAVDITTKGGHVFTMLEKDNVWHQDLYDKLVVPHFKINVDTLTWQNGAIANQQRDQCPYVRNILEFEPVPGFKFEHTQSHAKLAIAQPGQSPLTCVGGINEQISQTKRGGGTLCTTDPRVYKTFAAMVKKVEPCDGSGETDSKSDTGSTGDKSNDNNGDDSQAKAHTPPTGSDNNHNKHLASNTVTRKPLGGTQKPLNPTAATL